MRSDNLRQSEDVARAAKFPLRPTQLPPLALEPTTAEVVVGELRNHVTRRSGSRVFRTSLEALSEVEKKAAFVLYLFIGVLPWLPLTVNTCALVPRPSLPFRC